MVTVEKLNELLVEAGMNDEDNIEKLINYIKSGSACESSLAFLNKLGKSYKMNRKQSAQALMAAIGLGAVFNFSIAFGHARRKEALNSSLRFTLSIAAAIAALASLVIVYLVRNTEKADINGLILPVVTVAAQVVILHIGFFMSFIPSTYDTGAILVESSTYALGAVVAVLSIIMLYMSERYKSAMAVAVIVAIIASAISTTWVEQEPDDA